jgi:hypothetical protein
VDGTALEQIGVDMRRTDKNACAPIIARLTARS